MSFSGTNTGFDVGKIHPTVTAAETALLGIGDFEPLDVKVDVQRFEQEIKAFSGRWRPYLPKSDRVNPREGLSLIGLPDAGVGDVPSLGEACERLGRRVSEREFNAKTTAYHECKSLHPVFAMFQDVARTFLVKSHRGGYFVPHRDQHGMPRETFRVVVFLKNCGPYEYDWILETDRKLQIELGRAYYVNTKKLHRTISWVDDSTHLILNVPMTMTNVTNLFDHLQFKH